MKQNIEVVDQNNVAPTRNYTNKTLFVFCVVVLVVFAVGFLMGKNLFKGLKMTANPLNQINKEEVSTQIPAANLNDYRVRAFPSLTRNFTLYLYPDETREKCFYGINNKIGDGHGGAFLGVDKIPCSEGQTGIVTNFLGWVDGEKIVYNENPGIIKIFDVRRSETDLYQYDKDKYDFVSVNRSLRYWLFQKKEQSQNISYVLLDNNQNIVLDNIKYGTPDRGVLYDEVNDGFLFIKRTFIDESSSVEFKYLSLDNLELRILLTTEPVQTPGRGCGSEYLISKPGEIILTPGCYTIGSKYYGTDGNFHLKI